MGSISDPIYFTSINDDSIGGHNGSSQWGDSWDGIVINSGASANFNYAILKNGGYSCAEILNLGGTLTVLHSEITNSANFGIVHSGGTTMISQSSIHNNNGYGVYNSIAEPIDAKNNWWGSTVGPYHSLLNIDGLGNNRVSDYVDFIPFLMTDPAKTTPVSNILSDSTETEDDGLIDAKGVADKTKFTFSIDYTGTTDDVNLVTTAGTEIANYPLAKTDDKYSFTGTFPKGHYSYHYEANGGMVRFPEVGELSFTTGYSNVAFLPGLEASRLYDSSGKKIWEPDWLWHDNSQLYMNADGTSAQTGIYAGDIIDNAYVPGKGNIYRSFIGKMNQMKNDGTIKDWAPFPYDWRYDVESVVNNAMIQTFQGLALSSDTGKVTIISHSNGGLAAKVLSNKLGNDAPNLIDQMIFVASPEVGTPSAVGAILHGFGQGLPFDAIPLYINPTEARTLAVNMPSAYGLLPSANYFTYTDDPIITFSTTSPLLASWVSKYGETIHSGSTLRNFLVDQSRTVLQTNDILKSPAIGNPTMLSNAEILHLTLDNWTPPVGVHMTEIAGWGEETLKTIEYYQGVQTDCETVSGVYACNFKPILEFSPITTIDGDGTVVTSSALWTARKTGIDKYWVDLKKYNSDHKISEPLGRSHADILEVGEILDFVNNIIIQNGNIPEKYIIASAPSYNGNVSRLHFTLHSPLSLNLYDNLGNHTGIAQDGTVEENIPDSRYITFGEVQYISVPLSDLHLLMKGKSMGSFTLDIEEKQGDTLIKKTTFAGIPSNSSTLVSMDIPENSGISGASNLLVDENGDGKIEMSLSPRIGEVVLPDFTPPEISIQKPTLNQEFHLNETVFAEFAASDDSAVASIIPTDKMLDTSSVGEKSFTVTATDTQGNMSKRTVSYFVRYTFSGILQPINGDGSSIFKLNSTIPIKFRLKDKLGKYIPSAIAKIYMTKMSNGILSLEREAVSTSAASFGNLFRYDSTDQQYVFNLATKSLTTGTWRLRILLDDGTSKVINISLR